MGFLLSIVAALFFPGIIIRLKSWLSGRRGPGMFQPWRNILVLLNKGSVFSTLSSYVFRIAPVISLATIVCSMLLLPFPGVPSPFGFDGDFVFFAYLLALGKFLFIIAALDTGSSFEGMGGSREALYSLLVEPAFFILFGTLALLTGVTSMQEIFETFQVTGHNSFIIGFIGIYLLIQIAMIENSRMPVDDPKTHLELTMVHEVMILDHSGFDLALMHIGTALKFSMYGTLVANFLIPLSWPLPAGIGFFFAIQAGMAAVIGLMESFRARKKLARNPQFIVTLSSIALLAFILVLMITFNRI